MNAIVPHEENGSPLVLFTRATDVAGVCGEIVKRTARSIQGRKYVQVEGWQSIAAAYGCIASATNVERVEGGVRAIGELRRASDGALLGTAEGFVGEDEPTWYGGEVRGKVLPKRPEYAIRAMAQTRAISRVCRTAFAFVVVLIDNKLATTPAEEMNSDSAPEDPPKRSDEPPPIDAESERVPTLTDAVKNEVHDKTLNYLQIRDAVKMRALWQPFGADEHKVLWSMFDSTQRTAITKLLAPPK